MAVPRTPPPPKLYKYQRFNEQTLGNLKRGQIRFTVPREFNDPFDCALPMFDPRRITDADFLKAFNFYKEKLGSNPRIVATMCPGGVPSQTFRELIMRAAEKGAADRRKIMVDERGVACFSAEPLSIPMWSHYSAGHRGFCLEFDTGIAPFNTAFYVRYADAFPYVNPVDVIVDEFDGDPENDLLVATVLTKATCWQYEQEWRIMHREPNKMFGYDWHALTGIYFGAAMSPEHKEILCLMLYGSPTRLYDVQRDNTGFALRAVPATYTPPRYD